MFRDFTHDLENKLTSALPINAGVRTLNYDPLNRLDTYNPGTPKRFIYDGAEVVAELDASGSILGRYVRGDAPDEIITGYTSANPTARGWYHLDQRNSVIAVTDPNGAVTVVNRYDEYGQPQGGNYGTFQYTGQMWLGEIGIYNYKNRMYWPNERPGGRFMQTDPVGPVDSASLYQYALNDPVNLVDPWGLDVLCGGVMATVCGHRLPRSLCGGGLSGCPDGGGSSVTPPGGGPSGPGGSRRPGPTPKPKPKEPCTSPSDTVNAARDVLETAALLADVATVGLAAGGVTGGFAIGTRLLGYGLEGALATVNTYDAYRYGNWEPLASQGASLGARLLPGGRAIQRFGNAVGGPAGLRNPGVKEAGDLATQRYAGKLVSITVCSK